MPRLADLSVHRLVHNRAGVHHRFSPLVVAPLLITQGLQRWEYNRELILKDRPPDHIRAYGEVYHGIEATYGHRPAAWMLG